MQKRDAVTIGDIYGSMLRTVKVVKESSNGEAEANIAKSKKHPKMPENIFNSKMKLQKGGPTAADGFHKAINDPDREDNSEDEEDFKPKGKIYTSIDKLKARLEDKSLDAKTRQTVEAQLKELERTAQAEESEENFSESKKITRKSLNKSMSQKLTFDKLCESILDGSFENDDNANSDVDAFGLGDAQKDGETEGEGEGEDEVTVTLPREVAVQWLEALKAVLGEGEEGEDEGLDFETGSEQDDEGGEESGGGEFDEDEETQYTPNNKPRVEHGTSGNLQTNSLQNKANWKVNGKPQPGSQTASSKVTDKVGNDGDFGFAISGAKAVKDGKNNKVSNLKQGEDMFR